MKKFSVLIVVIVSFLTLIGCDMQSRRSELPKNNPCYGKEDEWEEKQCLKALKRLEGTSDTEQDASVPTTPSTAPATTSQPPKPSDMPELPVVDPQPQPRVSPTPPGVPNASRGSNPTPYVTADFLPVGDSGCMPFQSLSIHNNSNKFMEVKGDDLRPCGDGNLVQIHVSQGNGSTRGANVIPPGEIGTYYFYPWRDVGGQTVTTNGQKNYTIRVFDAGSVKGRSPATPAAQIIALKSFVVTPFADNWWRRYVTNSDIETAIAMR
ncbi:MAG: hypothetical protein ABIO72_03280 [Patescibacteria group bacterium]